MRFVLAFAVAVLGAFPAAAQSAGDRYGYGPSPAAGRSQTPQALEVQGFHPLTWANKAQASQAPAAAPSAPVRPEPLALAGQFDHTQARAAYQPFRPQAPYQAAPQQLAALTPPPARAVSRAPTTPPPAPILAPASRPEPASRGPALAGGPPAPRPATQPQPQPQPQQVAQAAPQGGEQVRFYSLHRAYGLTPDAIPAAAKGQNYVLIGPSATAPASKDRDDDDDSAKSDRPF